MSDQPNPIPLASRDDVAAALARLCAPLAGRLSPGGARLDLGGNAGYHSDDCARIEAFARPLWGIAPWVAGGGSFPALPAWRAGIASGFDPAHAEHWGEPRDYDQRFAELAPIAAAMLIAPGAFWEPLTADARTNVARRLSTPNSHELHNTNWLFFRVITNLALARLGRVHDAAKMTADLDRIEQWHLGDGWYSDGPTAQRDHYVAFAMHFYSLIYCAFAADTDPERCARFRERATRFARDYAAWFDADGGAVPMGRSLGYRFAQSAFWGALAFSGIEALPWGEVKGLWLRNLRWWLARPILDHAGILTEGYAYPNAGIGEQYSGPGSPYWAFKAFLPLALPASHPFWQAGEAAPDRSESYSAQPHARVLISRSEQGRNVQALCSGQWAAWRPRHDAAKYAKFCYSSRFGFSVSTSPTGLEAGAYDSMLAFTEDSDHFRVRRETFDHEIGPRHVASSWRPWPDVEVRTWLVAAGPWHLRAHFVISARKLTTIESGFAVACEGIDRLSTVDWVSEERRALVPGTNGLSQIQDLAARRRGVVYLGAPGSNLMAPRTAIPALVGDYPAGQNWLACAVLGHAGPDAPPMPFTWKPLFRGYRIEAPGYSIDLVR